MVGESVVLQQWQFLSRACSGVACVLMYAAVPIVYKMQVLGLATVLSYAALPLPQLSGKSAGASARRAQLETQKRLLLTMGLSGVFTLVFYVTPNLARAVLVNYRQPGALPHCRRRFTPTCADGFITADMWNVLSSTLACAQNVNPCFNIILYMSRHRDIRAAIIALVTCTELSR